jgi:hypothetical protein
MSIFGKSIYLPMNKLNSIGHRIRNTSLRFIVFNDIYKIFKEKSLEKMLVFKELYSNTYTMSVSTFYDIVYTFYSLDEEDRNNLELVLSLLY